MKEKNTFDKIYDVVGQIPEGKVASYGQIAELAGNRRWARVVGYALHVVPDSMHLPCHRVVTKEGRVSGAFLSGGVNRQARMLEEEGVEIEEDRVDMRKYQWSKRIF
ncbi:MGMT family protein [[Clostridium] hylemonae]|uniref:6-O-methylguanine DNA methyltransferase, DNA binding domain protein n=1 Tax=[Clostridium] hylemonae DSM 15053 TaxID=553973 RepID=C0C4E2_9FIRM|nr:MGMT family protein [[Clostridium] hylemonae]EEG72935.1 6-O-methylguanine DNA methyltransferase, DNA binding domain protein [[Clostridium] hylemonae DSM 15053]QEK16312.1 DNA base-flipping protein [[Clostridium] hylemonae DSM 15053]BDF03826.1 methylated-DNA--protein-cysteine methyltransferase [[Clostridium] hylemonae]